MRTRRWIIALSLLALTAPPLLAAHPVLAQDDPLDGTVVEALGGISPMMAEGRQLVLLRLTLPPGASIQAHSHPGAVVITVESGTFATRFIHGSGTITRAGIDGAPGAAETPETGEAIELHAGDTLAYDQDAGHTMDNPGAEPLVLLASALLASDEPGFMFQEGEADAE